VTEHPGTVEYVDGATGKILHVADAADVEDAIGFAPGADGTLQPVTRIVITTVGERREVRQLGADGALLRTTFQRVA
jgi:hypothetical protein